MSSIKINSNLASLGTQRRLGGTTAELRRSFERLSSGLRINRASDDAAGLAISTSLNSDNRVFNQGIRNLNDGLSLLNVADGAISELSGIAIRIRELAEQSANGTLSNTQREALDQEAQELSAEYTRIAQTTEVNGLKLFDGSLAELSLQAGYGENGAITSSLGGAVGDGTFDVSISYSIGAYTFSSTSGDFNQDGYLDIAVSDTGGDAVGILLGRGDGTFEQVVSYSIGDSPRRISTGDLNGDGILDIATINASDDSLGVILGRGDGTFEPVQSFASGDNGFSLDLADVNGDGVLDALSSHWNHSTVGVFIGQGDGSFAPMVSYPVGSSPRDLKAGDLNGDGNIDIVIANLVDDTVGVLLGQGDGTFTQGISINVADSYGINLGDLNSDGILDIVTASTNVSDFVAVLLGQGDGTFEQALTFSVGNNPSSVNLGDFNGDGILDAFTTHSVSSTVSILIGEGDGSFGTISSLDIGALAIGSTIGDFDGDGVVDIATADGSRNSVSILLANTTSGVGPLTPFSLATQSDALQAMAPLDRKIEQVATQKGTIGAFQSRIETAINNLQITSTNVKAAESRIADVDTATESARLARLNILQQAGASVLAQANIQPQIALRLLGN